MNLLTDPALSVLQSWRNRQPNRQILAVRVGPRWCVELLDPGSTQPHRIYAGKTIAAALAVTARMLQREIAA